MWNVVTVLGGLLLLCHTVKSQQICTKKKICTGCSLNQTKLQCGNCVIERFQDVCKQLIARSKKCVSYIDKEFIETICENGNNYDEDENGHSYDDNDDYVPSNDTNVPSNYKNGPYNGNAGKSRKPTIVIVVCVSVVVVVVAVLLTGVYCWRVRRGSNGRRKAEDVELRNNARTNDAYKGDNGPFASRPGSTYNTINDLQLDHEYDTLEQQNSMLTHVERNQRTVDSDDNRKHKPEAKWDSDGNNAYGDGEYNRINYNKRPEATSDPSYSHLGSIGNESDYNTSETDNNSKTSTYNYGVPIKIKDPPNTKPADTQTRPAIRVPNVADDDYVIPKKVLEEHPQTPDDKPKAIVNPLNFIENGGYSSRYSEDNNAEVTIGDMKREPVDISGHGTDGYEKAIIAKLESTGNTDNEITKIELPRVQIGNSTEDKQNDGYETAEIKHTKTAGDDSINDSDKVRELHMDRTDLNSSSSSVKVEPKMNRNDGYETARICQ